MTFKGPFQPELFCDCMTIAPSSYATWGGGWVLERRGEVEPVRGERKDGVLMFVFLFLTT